MFLTENQLDEWVRGNADAAQGVIVELVARLVAVSSPGPKERRFPLGDSIGQPGPDGILDTEFPYEPFVPVGKSYWEIGTGIAAPKKATSDYAGLVRELSAEERGNATFVFVTPLSGRRGWKLSGKGGQQKWRDERLKHRDWKDIRVLDGSRLIEWVRQFAAVELWLAERVLGLEHFGAEALEQRWILTQSIGAPPPLCAEVFLVNRDEARSKLDEVLSGTSTQLRLRTRFPGQVADFVAAHVASLDPASRSEAFGRSIVVSNEQAWNALVTLPSSHVLIADASLDLTGDLGTRLIQKARRARHSIVFGSLPGGVPDPSASDLHSPKSHMLQDALRRAGYSEERARILASRSGGNLGSLLRCLQNLSLTPEWAQGTPASDLLVAHLLGAWDERYESDRAAAEALAGNAYGEWIGTIRELASRSSTPLTHRESTWSSLLRYEAWYALGPRVFDDHLKRLQTVAVNVLGENDPRLALPTSDRFAAALHGKARKHSNRLRHGIATTLALLGTHSTALSSCTAGRPEATALLVLRALLHNAEWERWASLEDVLPLLAESSPSEFLDAAEEGLQAIPCPFDFVFAQEGDGIFGGNYISGLLWALETLAWDDAFLRRAALVLAALASRDPGGRYANRPINSLQTIFLPWLPQTCAPVEVRAAVVKSVLQEFPAVGWDLLIGLLPQMGSFSIGSRRPEWRGTIPEDWDRHSGSDEYMSQLAHYGSLALAAAKSEPTRLALLIEHAERLPAAALTALRDHLASTEVASLPASERLTIWTALADMVSKHRKFATAEWAMSAHYVDLFDDIATSLAPHDPSLIHRRLFSERDFELFDEVGDYHEQAQLLEERRDAAVQQIASDAGIPGVLAFAADVEAPWKVGIVFGSVAAAFHDAELLPGLLASAQYSEQRFLAGYVWRRFRLNGWQWVDDLEIDKWSVESVGQLLCLLPFVPEAWERANSLLGARAHLYWGATPANPYDSDDGLAVAAEKLLQHERPLAALRCLVKLRHFKNELDSSLAVRALLAGPGPTEQAQSTDSHHLLEIIKRLQSDPTVSRDELMQVEWAYLPLLRGDLGGSPRTLSEQLSSDPRFFCEVLRLCFRSTNAASETSEENEERDGRATNAYRLLREWSLPPGTLRDEPFLSGEALREWIAKVRLECAASGHLDSAMSMIGHVLVRSPQDPDGLWIHRAAAQVLDAPDASEMRDGFRTQLLNSRGVHWVDPSGSPEDALAADFRSKAVALDRAGFSRLGSTVRSVGDSYEFEAGYIRARHREEY